MYWLYLPIGSWKLVISDLVEMAAGLTPLCNKGINVVLAITSSTAGDSDKIDADLNKLTNAIKDTDSEVTLNYTDGAGADCGSNACASSHRHCLWPISSRITLRSLSQ